MTRTDDMIQIGFIRGAHALKGHVSVHVFSGNEETLTDYGKLFTADGKTSFEITITGEKGGDFLCLVNDIRDRNGADTLRGTKLYIPASALPEPDEDEFYIKDLIGLTVLDTNGTVLGKVFNVTDFGDYDALDITFTHNGTSELPKKQNEYLLFTKENVPELNIAAGTLTVQLPAGLLDTPAQKDQTE